MRVRMKVLVGTMVAGAAVCIYLTPTYPSQRWLHFFVYLAAILLSSGMKVGMPKSDGTMSVNYPFILLGIVEFSPLQATTLAVISVIAQCEFRVVKPFTWIQILFNAANVTAATLLAWSTFLGMQRFLHGELAPALAAAASVYFLANTIPVGLILAWESNADPLARWWQEFAWYYPFYLVGAMLAATAYFISTRYGWLTSLLLVPMVYTVYRAYQAQMAIIRDREGHIVETEALHLRTIEGLAMAIEAKDQNTHRHLMRVRVYVSELGMILGLEKPVLQALQIAAFLHDIGKLAVPEHILNKPGKLTPEEFEKVKIHTVVGAEILERVQFPYPVVPIVRSHHEAWDGSGYPDGLKGDAIPIGARILTAVDCFDALASDRPYRRALPLQDAMAMLKEKSGIQFDPEVLRQLEAHYPRLEELARQQIEEVAPLNTDRFVERGAAPAAGFAPAPDAHTGTALQPADVRSARMATADVMDASQKTITALEGAAGSFSAKETSALMARCVQQLIPFDCLAVFIKRGELLHMQFSDGPCAPAFSPQPLPVGEGLSGWVAHCERPIVNGNPTVEPHLRRENGLLTGDSSALSIPLFRPDGPVAGVLSVYSRANAAFSKDHLLLLENIQPAFSRALHAAMAGNGVADPPADFAVSANTSNVFAHGNGRDPRSVCHGQPVVEAPKGA